MSYGTMIPWTSPPHPNDWNAPNTAPLMQARNAFIAQANAANLQAQLALQALQQPRPWMQHTITFAQLAAATQWGAAYEPDPAPEDAGITVGEIVAWRAWVIDCDGTLRSTAMQTAWRPGEPMTGDLDVAGVHAWKTFDQARQYAMVGLSMIVGQVELWGAVVEHADGYRAEYAAPVSLCYALNDDARRWADIAAARYNIPNIVRHPQVGKQPTWEITFDVAKPPRYPSETVWSVVFWLATACCALLLTGAVAVMYG